MALRVWLPLNGNLNNQGLSNIQINNTGAIINNAGKIGKAYEFGANHWLRLENYAAEFLTYKEFTLSVWFKCTAQNTSHGGSALISGGNWNQPANLLNLGLSGWATDHYTRLIISGSGTWDAGYNYNFNLNTWYHVALTSGNGKMRAYVNGELIGDSYSAFTPASLEQDWICIGNGTYYSGFIFNGLMNDVRIYDECLSPKQIKEISKGLVTHYKLDNSYNTDNLIINGFGELGTVGWNSTTNISTTEIPPNVAGVKASFYNGNSTINNSKYRIPIYPNHSYTISVYIKSSGATSGTTYPSIFPYDVDKKFIDYYKCKTGFWSVSETTLTQPLNPGDTVIHAADLSKWDTGDNYGYHVAIFGYADSTGYIYPDLEYTQDAPVFGTRTDKSHINKTDNTITLNAAYNGAPRPVGTKICQSTEGSTYYYPFGGLALSGLSDWTFKTLTIIPVNEDRLRWARYWTYSTYSNTYHAAIKLIDNTWMNAEVTDCSGNGYNGVTNGTSKYNVDSPRYEGSIKFDANTSYIKLPVLVTSGFSNSFTISCWSKNSSIGGKMMWGFGNGNRLNIYPTDGVLCCNTGDSAKNPYKNNGSSIEYSSLVGDWHHYVMTGDGTNNKLYIDGELAGTATTYKGLTGTQMYISGWDTGTQYRWIDGSISDFRIYSTALSANDIKELYQTSAMIDNGNNIYAYEFIEE